MNQYKGVDYVSFDKIEDHPEVQNIRSEITKADVKELMSSIKDRGIQNPLTCFVKDGKYYLVSGFRRRKAVQEIMKEDPKSKIGSIPVLVKEYKNGHTFLDATYDNAIENIQRKDVNPYDMAVRLKALIDSGIDKQKICKAISKSITWLNETLKILNADPDVQNALRKGDVSISEAKAMAKLPADAQSAVARGLASTKKDNPKQAKAIKKAMKDATEANVIPTRKMLNRDKNILFEIIKEMRAIKETDTELYFILSGCLKMTQYALGEKKSTNFDKIAKKYNLKIGEDGNRIKEKKPSPKSQAVASSKKKKTAKKSTKNKK